MEDLKLISGLTDQELRVMDSITQGYNEWLKLEMTHPYEMQDFINAIHMLMELGKAYNVGVDVNNYEPINLEEVLSKF